MMRDAMILARRNLEHVRQIPEKLLDVTLQPVMFVLLFAFVFGGVIAIPDGNYREYLIGGILIQTLAFGIMGPATSMNTDLGEGMVDRLRTLPIKRSSYLMGHMIAEMIAVTIAIAVLCFAGLIIGWGIHSDLPHAIAGFALLELFAFAMLWLGTLIGVMVRSPDAAQGIIFVTVFPLTFVATTFVPAEGLGSGLRQIAEWNPVSSMAAAVRELFGNPTAIPDGAALPLQHPFTAALIWCGVLLAIFVPLTLWRFNVRTAD